MAGDLATMAQPVLGVAITMDRYYYLGAALLAVVVVFAILKARSVYEEIHEDIEPEHPQEILRTLEDAHHQGELDAEEFARVKSMLEGSARPPAGAEKDGDRG